MFPEQGKDQGIHSVHFKPSFLKIDFTTYSNQWKNSTQASLYRNVHWKIKIKLCTCDDQSLLMLFRKEESFRRVILGKHNFGLQKGSIYTYSLWGHKESETT